MKMNPARHKKYIPLRMEGLMNRYSGSENFRDLEATELYGPECKRATHVRKYLLLVLPEGDKYEYRCGFCNETVGSKIDKNMKQNTLIV